MIEYNTVDPNKVINIDITDEIVSRFQLDNILAIDCVLNNLHNSTECGLNELSWCVVGFCPDAKNNSPLKLSGLLSSLLLRNRRVVSEYSSSIRAAIKRHTENVEYKNQFADAQSAIDLQLREIARQLLLLDQSTLEISDASVLRKHYLEGAWVQKGSVVLSVQK